MPNEKFFAYALRSQMDKAIREFVARKPSFFVGISA